MGLPGHFPRDHLESKQKTSLTFRLMCGQRSLGLLGVGHYLPGQEIRLGKLWQAQLKQSSLEVMEGKHLEREGIPYRRSIRNKTNI